MLVVMESNSCPKCHGLLYEILVPSDEEEEIQAAYYCRTCDRNKPLIHLLGV